MSNDGAELTEAEVQRLIESRAEDESAERVLREMESQEEPADDEMAASQAEWWTDDGRYDDDPSPYAGTYSEE